MEKRTVYIVEDMKLQTDVYLSAIRDTEKYEVLDSFFNAEQCLDAMKTRQVDIILMDLGLPGMSGIEAAKIIKENYKNTKVVALTSHEQEADVYECINAGVRGYMIKDMETPKFEEIFDYVYNDLTYFDPKISSCLAKLAPNKNAIAKYKLTNAEMEVLIQIRLTNAEIASKLYLSVSTVKAHLTSIYAKFGVENRTEAAIFAVSLGIELYNPKECAC